MKPQQTVNGIDKVFSKLPKNMFPCLNADYTKWILPKGYILFRCHPSNVLTPKQDYDTNKHGCYFCDNCPRLAISMVYEHMDQYPNGLVLSVYRLKQDIICNNGKYSPGNHYDTIIQSLYTWIDYNATSPDSNMWCHEVFIQSDELYKLQQIDETFVTPQDVMNFYKTPSYDSDYVYNMIFTHGKTKEIGMMDDKGLQRRDAIFNEGIKKKYL